jgi:hypothetical protein
VDLRETPAQLSDAGQPAPDLQGTRDHRDGGDQKQKARVRGPDEMDLAEMYQGSIE